MTTHGGMLLALGTAGDCWLHMPSDVGSGVDLSQLRGRSLAGANGLQAINDLPLLAFYADA